MVELTNKELMDTDGGFAWIPAAIICGICATFMKSCCNEKEQDTKRKRK